MALAAEMKWTRELEGCHIDETALRWGELSRLDVVIFLFLNLEETIESKWSVRKSYHPKLIAKVKIKERFLVSFTFTPYSRPDNARHPSLRNQPRFKHPKPARVPQHFPHPSGATHRPTSTHPGAQQSTREPCVSTGHTRAYSLPSALAASPPPSPPSPPSTFSSILKVV